MRYFIFLSVSGNSESVPGSFKSVSSSSESIPGSHPATGVLPGELGPGGLAGPRGRSLGTAHTLVRNLSQVTPD